MIITNYLLWLLFCLLSILGLLAAAANNMSAGLVLILLADLILICWVSRCEKKFFSPMVIFCLFLAIYGWYGVFLFEIFPEYGGEFYLTSKSAFEYLLCNFLAKLGYSIPFFWLKPSNNSKLEVMKSPPPILAFCCLFFCATVTSFELINFFRAGGFPVLLGGKALYQSLVDELSFTLPTMSLFYIAIASFSLFYAAKPEYGNTRNWKLIIFICCILLTPLMGIYLVLGRRGPIMNVFLIFFAAKELVKGKTNNFFKIAVFGIILIFFSAAIFWFRNIGLMSALNGEFSFPINQLFEVFIQGLGEFRAPYGNFNVFLQNQNKIPIQLGVTYWHGFLILFPGYVLPFSKPQSITYDFRDTFFSSWATHGSIAGTAFSPILEAFINFSYYALPLCFLFYHLSFRFLIGFFRRNSVFNLLIYLAVIPLAQSFHRSEYGNFLSISVEMIIFSLFCRFFFNLINLKTEK